MDTTRHASMFKPAMQVQAPYLYSLSSSLKWHVHG